MRHSFARIGCSAKGKCIYCGIETDGSLEVLKSDCVPVGEGLKEWKKNNDYHENEEAKKVLREIVNPRISYRNEIDTEIMIFLMAGANELKKAVEGILFPGGSFTLEYPYKNGKIVVSGNYSHSNICDRVDFVVIEEKENN